MLDNLVEKIWLGRHQLSVGSPIRVPPLFLGVPAKIAAFIAAVLAVVGVVSGPQGFLAAAVVAVVAWIAVRHSIRRIVKRPE